MKSLHEYMACCVLNKVRGYIGIHVAGQSSIFLPPQHLWIVFLDLPVLTEMFL